MQILRLCPRPTESEEEKTLITQSCLILCNPMDCSPPGSFVHGIFQARILEWVAFPSPGDRRSSQLRDWTHVSSIAGRFFTINQNLHFNEILRRFVLTLTFEKSETEKQRKKELFWLMWLRRILQQRAADWCAYQGTWIRQTWIKLEEVGKLLTWFGHKMGMALVPVS